MKEQIRPAKLFATILATLLAVVLIALLLWLIRGEQRFAAQATATPSLEIGFTLDIPQKALWRNYLVVSAETAPGTHCNLMYIPPSGDTQEMSTVADEDGNCTWRWKIEETDGKGNGRLIFAIDGRSETHFIEIRRSF
jgi:hypothetical protein